MQNYFLELKNLHKSYQDGSGIHHILKGAELHSEQGETIAILGNSGSGKSTLLNLIAGIDLPDQGEVLIQGKSLGQLSEKKRTLLRRKKMGFVFQSFNLIPTLNVEENLMLPLEMNGIPNNSGIIPQMLGGLNLQGREESYPDRLSGGEQQRVAVARALMHQPSLLLADEPTGNLDGETSQETLKLINHFVHRSGTTMIIATHSQKVVEWVDRVFNIEDGILIELKSTEAMKRLAS
ncbi:MAG TPA: ABC transporter ATP-binding protein [SAR324 cluster bacterium]|jgi:putative ABC transport system ATP-binding protein|nr:ABC transporter ATP-binding protein [SAR324 cluster bacterium]MEE1575756.1 ABC transporter ATP-binding protein [Deltaproteobacteria bacterium]MDP6245680.1 ABC transporter ATP-binding protein [SAR324 cluster bacterium]MDP6462273.1 ABC transporter ATP-binding protein [SAR324 cluster bacterium]MDP7334758.1 ABC transporter ATP-binding protein [SAR324 cluster bacterium]|tara:strand:- start:654 stop:1361 length:708 start_codon:yes stop_codon:yes gene_type:complete